MKYAQNIHNYWSKIDQNDQEWWGSTLLKSDIFRAYHINNFMKNSRTSRVLRKSENFKFSEKFKIFRKFRNYSIHIPLKLYICTYTCIFLYL